MTDSPPTDNRIERIVWRLLDLEPEERAEQILGVLDRLEAQYIAVRPEADVDLLRRWFADQVEGACSRISARQDSFCGLRIGGSA
jgi:hypothetical protein